MNPVTDQSELIADLQTLNDISRTLNQFADVQSALNTSLARLIDLMGVETGWIFVVDPAATDRWGGRGFRLAAHHNLPPAMSVTNPDAWDKGCDCQKLCQAGALVDAYNEVRCSRLSGVTGDRHGLAVHATTPLRAGGRALGILNVAAPDWASFTPRSLSLLTNVGNQMGIALERARLFDALQEQRIHEQAALLDLSQQLLSRRDLDDLMAFIVEEVRRQLAADACAVLLTGPDPDYLHFRAAAGWLGDPVGGDYLVPADDSTGSGQVMRTQQALLIEDLQAQDPPLWTSEWLEREGFRAAAMVPLVADGQSIGALIIDSRRPRRLTELEVRFLRLMANQAALAIETARFHREELQRERFDEELAVARKIQMSMLPAELPRLPGWEFAAHFEAAHHIGGDFYDMFTLPGEPGRWGIVIADVSDKGIPAALFMALSRTTIRNLALRGRAPAEVLSWANRYIQEDSQSDMFLSAFYAELTLDTGQLVYANAGHNPPLLWRQAEGTFSRLTLTSPLLGVLEEINVAVRTVTLLPGDALILFTDGITEAIDVDFEEFGDERLESAIRLLAVEQPLPSADDVRTTIADEVRRFSGSMVQYDDMTLLIVKRLEAIYDQQ
ncbi:putative Stage II sporulation E family protein [Candidatus Promineifilum breve]|uniref:Stage II sporulation E family protein n=1 Tax=Candidatus Promineifilum breve TaxID=1806508 RepID=A0A161K2M9_9CHLR|nr:putative Stage II sporulation E family protein [Candidatus Promineifilum breve]